VENLEFSHPGGHAQPHPAGAPKHQTPPGTGEILAYPGGFCLQPLLESVKGPSGAFGLHFQLQLRQGPGRHAFHVHPSPFLQGSPNWAPPPNYRGSVKMRPSLPPLLRLAPLSARPKVASKWRQPPHFEPHGFVGDHGACGFFRPQKKHPRGPSLKQDLLRVLRKALQIHPCQEIDRLEFAVDGWRPCYHCPQS
jgi:hypothetical protein